MSLRFYILSLFVLLSVRPLDAQQVFFSNLDEEGLNVIYESESYIKGAWHTNGWYVGYVKGDILSVTKTKYFTGGFSVIQHPKEQRQNRDILVAFNDVRPYKYGKINSLYVLKGGIGNKHYLSVKARERNVRIAINYEYGLNIGFLRPYYLRVTSGEGDGMTRNITYTGGDNDPFLNETRIIGGTGLGFGWNDMKLRPGVHLDASFVFDFGQNEARINSLELGFMVDVFAKEVELMATRPGQFVFANLYAAMAFGSRK